MSFDELEISNYGGGPVILYEFYRRSGVADLYWRYNTTDQNVVTLNGATFLPIPISDDGVKQDGEATHSELNITMGVTEDFPAMFRTAGASPSDTVYVTLRKIHFDDFHPTGIWATDTAIGSGGTTVVALASGAKMFPGGSVTSPSGEFALQFQFDGNVTLIRGGTTVLWTTGTQGSGATEFVMQADGNLVLYGPSGALWNTGITQAGAHLVLQDDGNLVIYSIPVPDPRVIWVGTVNGMTQLDEIRVRINCSTLVASFKRGGLRLSWTRGCPYALYDSQCKMDPANFRTTTQITELTGNSLTSPDLGALPDDYFAGGYVEWNLSPVLWATGTDVGSGAGTVVALASGAKMVPGDSVTSPSGEFALQFQFDGNVTLVQNGTTILWTTDTAGSDAVELFMQTDGNLVLYGAEPIWATNTAGEYSARLVLQDDGNLALYPLHNRLIDIVERRGIKSHTGDTVILSGSAFGLIVTQSARFYPGCRRTRQVCNDKFDNILNYGGFPDTPGKSPYTGDPVF